jgi:hypothetical protein
LPLRLSKIDALLLPDHGCLSEDDECHFIMEWTKGGGYSASPTNQFIANLKIPASEHGRYRYQYKLQAINRAAQILAETLNPAWLQAVTLVPVPPSACKEDEAHDDRMLQVLRALGNRVPGLDIRELVIQRESTTPTHLRGDQRLTVEELLELYAIDERLTDPQPGTIAVMDDILTAGAHFKAMKQILQGRFTLSPVVGIFLARRIFPPDERPEL